MSGRQCAHTVRRFALVKGYSQVRALVELLCNTRSLGLSSKTNERPPYVSEGVEEVGLMWHNPNSLVLVEAPEIAIQPVGIRRLPAEVAQVKRRGGDA